MKAFCNLVHLPISSPPLYSNIGRRTNKRRNRGWEIIRILQHVIVELPSIKHLLAVNIQMPLASAILEFEPVALDRCVGSSHDGVVDVLVVGVLHEELGVAARVVAVGGDVQVVVVEHVAVLEVVGAGAALVG